MSISTMCDKWNKILPEFKINILTWFNSGQSKDSGENCLVLNFSFFDIWNRRRCEDCYNNKINIEFWPANIRNL